MHMKIDRRLELITWNATRKVGFNFPRKSRSSFEYTCSIGEDKARQGKARQGKEIR